MASGPDGFDRGGAFGFCFGEPILLHAMGIALIPVVWSKGTQPLWGNVGQGVEGCAHRLANAHHPVDRSYRCQDMGGIGALATSGFDESPFLEAGEQRFEYLILHLPFNPPRAKL